MTGQLTEHPPAAPDNGWGAEMVPVAMIIAAAQDAVRSAPARDRAGMWQAFQTGLATAREKAPGRMPWTPPDDVGEITRGDAVAALSAAFREIGDPADQHRAMERTAGKMEAAEKSAAEKRSREPAGKALVPGKLGIRVCALPGCGTEFAPRHVNARYHNDACRQQAWRDRQRIARDA